MKASERRMEREIENLQLERRKMIKAQQQRVRRSRTPCRRRGRSRKTFSELGLSGKTEAAKRVVTELNKDHTPEDTVKILQKASKNIMKLSISETNELFDEMGISFFGQRIIRSYLHRKGKNILASETLSRRENKEIAQEFEIVDEKVSYNDEDGLGRCIC